MHETTDMGLTSYACPKNVTLTSGFLLKAGSSIAEPLGVVEDVNSSSLPLASIKIISWSYSLKVLRGYVSSTSGFFKFLSEPNFKISAPDT